MKFTCDRCDAQYMISDEKVGPNGVKVRCKKCSHIILVRRPAENGAAAAESPVVAAAPAPAPGGPGEGLDAELGHAFDNAFGNPPARAPSAGADPDATQAVSPEEAAGMAARSAPSEPAATEWYVAIGQAQVGPLPLVEVRRKWEAGDVGPDSLVWRPGMGDWAPLTGVSDLAAYLAPVARGAARPQPAATPAPTRAAGATAAAEPRRTQDVAWKPVGASALAALASEEIAARPAEPEAKPAVSVKSLVDGLPDGGGVDPTGAVPLQIKALEATGEAPVAKSGVARGAEQLRRKRSSTRMLVAAIVLLLLVLVGGGGYVGYDLFLRPRLAAPPPAPVAAEKAAPPAEKPAEPVAAAPPATPAPAAQPAPAPAPAAAAAAPPAPQPEPASTSLAAPPPEPAPAAAKEPEKRKPEPTAPARAARAEKKPAKKPEKVATREEPPPKAAPQAAATQPAPQPAKKKGGDLLDFDSSDAALDEALGGKGSSGRSVYVPPAPGGGDEQVADRVTDSQITETIMTRVTGLQQCAADKSSGSGVLKMNWAINPDGSVRNLKCVSPEYASTPFAACVTNLIKGLKFPKSVNGRSDVTFPFKF